MPRMRAPSRPLLVFDGTCGFCRRWIERWRMTTGDRVEAAPYQDVAERFPEIPRERFAAAVHLIEPDGRVTRGAEAVFRSLAAAPGNGVWLALYERVPGWGALSEAAYRVVARHRGTFSWLTEALWGRHLVPPGDARAMALFGRLIGLVYVAAFVSIAPQLAGLIGADGILPAAGYLHAARAQLGGAAWLDLPTLAWFGAGDHALSVIAWSGALCGALAALGLMPAFALAGAWVCYLSIVSVGQDFLWFQWDSLLLEAGFVALLAAPWRWRVRGLDAGPAPRAARWLARWLLFRLMVSSAAAKWTSGDPTWHSLTALTFHYQTQPLPPWTAWYAHHLPARFHAFSALAMFAIEGFAPFLLPGPRRVRLTALGSIASLQALILISGNYGFFNPLALTLCVPWLDDAVWGVRGFARRAPAASAALASAPRAATRAARGLIAATLFVASLAPLSSALHRPSWLLAPAFAAYRALAPVHVVNPYGLFAVMTVRRAEIVIEGSRDGRAWQPYEFRYKPGDVTQRPAFTTPHMPRLDWQMWFAALGDVRQNPWLVALCGRLLEGSAPVRALLARDPFGATPPRFVRATLYDYRFSTAAERRADGAWWVRRPTGTYLPALELVDGELRLAAVASADSS
jgi:predicted DCC family thiol-disulfide oxidoreductase YuxK